MPLVLSILVGLILSGGAGVLLWLLWQMLRNQATVRRSLEVEMLQVLLPKDLAPQEKEEGIGQDIKERIAVAEQFLSTLSHLPTSWWDRWLYGRPLIVFEITTQENGVITFFAGTERRFLDHLEKQIYALYPEAEVRLARDFTIFNEGDAIQAGLLKLQRSHHLPLATYKELEVDPMQSLTGALAKIQKHDSAVIQFVCQAARQRTRRRGTRAARRTMLGKQTDVGSGSVWRGTSEALLGDRQHRERREAQAQHLTPRAQQKIELVEQKLAQPQFDVTIRVGVAIRNPDDAQRVFNGLVAAFSQYDLPDLNSLQLIPVKEARSFLRDLIFRLPSYRHANTLSTTEVASLFHFPLPTTGTPTILWRGSKIAPAPAGLPEAGIMLGHNDYRGISTPIHLAEDDRRRHLYLIGQTGTGKTTLFLNMIVQDIQQGRGVGVVDPHGDLIEDILPHIPPERTKDVILFDPRDTDRPPAFNILEVHEEGQKDLVVNEVVQILQKLAARLNPESIGPMFEHYLRNALLALVEDPEATLIDVPRMFVDAEFRNVILSKNTNPTVRQFWEQEFAQSQRGQLSADMLSYVISKLGRFISNRTVRNLIGQAKSAFDMRRVMDEQKILLCNLSKGSLGDINSDLLGFVLVSKIQIAALGRSNIPEAERRDFYLYLDEFQNFTTDSIAVILSEARKYHLNLNLTHQFVQQLPDSIREAVFGNVGTIISYRVGVDDAEFLAKQFEPVFHEYDLLNLERFTACIRLLSQGTPQRAFSLKIMPPPVGSNPQQREAVRAWSRQQYGRAKAEVEEEILARFEVGRRAATTPPSTTSGYMSESLLDIG
jgi:hypothetical protein